MRWYADGAISFTQNATFVEATCPIPKFGTGILIRGTKADTTSIRKILTNIYYYNENEEMNVAVQALFTLPVGDFIIPFPVVNYGIDTTKRVYDDQIIVGAFLTLLSINLYTYFNVTGIELVNLECTRAPVVELTVIYSSGVAL